MLRHYISAKQTDWYEHLAALEFAYNSSVNPSTGQTPFQLDLGYSPHTPHSLLAHTSNLPHAESFLATLQSDLQATRNALAFAQSRQAHYHNLHRRPASFTVGDLVWVSTRYTQPPFFKMKGTPKLCAKWIGPWLVTEIINNNAIHMKLPPHLKAHDVINAQYLKAHVPSPFPDRQSCPPPAVNADTHEYFVDAILAHRLKLNG